MIRRPKAGETEEDLLREEEEFLKQSGKEERRKRTHEVDSDEGKSSTNLSDVIGDIVERNRRDFKPPTMKACQSKGFPALFCIDPGIAPSKKEKKSLFALHMEKRKADRMDVDDDKVAVEVGEEQTKTEIEHQENGRDVVFQDRAFSSASDDIKESVHVENVEKVNRMSEEEILEAQRKLYESLDPKLISLLKNRGKSRESSVNTKKTAVEMEVDDPEEETEVKEKLSTYVGENWVNMDFVEKDKLEWVGDIPDSKSLEPDQPYSARFDFKGELQPFGLKAIDVTKALHHHGEEPERPGYTIQELYQLSRSTVLQQRVLAINTLANILRKTKLGYYDVCFDGSLLHKLLDSDLFLLLRFSIDENALIPPAINCLRRLLHNDTDEYCLDKLLGVTDEDEQPLLFDEMEASEEEEKELKDNTIIKSDLIKGVLRTDLLVRVSYILNNLPCDRETITNAILCFIRISRHSEHSCEQISTTANLLSFVYSVIKCDNPIYQGVKLFRLLVGQSRELAESVAKNLPMTFLLSFVTAESMTEMDKRDFYLLKLESLYLWRNLLRHDLMIDDFASWTPCFLRLLRFYVEKVDLRGDSDFDFEFFSALLSLLTLAVRKKLRIDSNYVAVMRVCLEKWLNQLLRFGQFNYAGLKALGTCFRFFEGYLDAFQTDQTSLIFVRKIDSLICQLLTSPAFEKMSTNLITFSHVLVAGRLKRDPKNLPSLSSVYEEGYDFLKIVDNRSSLAFFVPFVKYLKRSYAVTHSCRDCIESFVACPNVRKYTAKAVGIKKHVDNWFSRYEISLLTDILDLCRTVGDAETARLSFRVLAMTRSDDINAKTLLSVVTDRNIWNSDRFPDGLFEVYLEGVHKPGLRVRYVGDLVGDDWMFRILTELRGRDAVAEVARALQFASFVTSEAPQLVDRVPYDVRYRHLCAVYMTDANVFDDDVQRELRVNLRPILANRDRVRLERKTGQEKSKKSFYDLYTELITQYAGVSYGLHVFAEFVLFPLQNRFDVSYRKLLWFEYLHVLRVVTLPYPAPEFVDVEEFAEPCETDESLLATYLNSVSNGVILRNRNPFVYMIAVTNVGRYLKWKDADPKLAAFLRQRIESVKNERVRRDIVEVGERTSPNR